MRLSFTRAMVAPAVLLPGGGCHPCKKKQWVSTRSWGVSLPCFVAIDEELYAGPEDPKQSLQVLSPFGKVFDAVQDLAEHALGLG
jgi:hypothetical protein